MRSLIAAIALVCVAATQAAAGTELPLKKGDRVRIKAPVEEGVFVLVDLGPDAFLIRDPDGAYPRKIRIADISSLEVAVPMTPGESLANGASFGAAVGLVSGALLGFALGDDPGYEQGGSELSLAMSAGGKALVFGVLFLVGGAIVGGVAGSMHPGERWEQIPLSGKLDAGMARDGTVRVGFAFSVAGVAGE